MSFPSSSTQTTSGPDSVSSTMTMVSSMTDQEFQTYALTANTWSCLEYRAELSRRFASIFDADHLIIFDDVAMVTGESERLINLSAIQGCDRSLLPALWLAIGFEYGVTILVYSPPNPIELREFLSIRRKFQDQLQRSIIVRILFDGMNDILALYEQSIEEYTELCLKYMTQTTFRPEFSSEYHIEQLKTHADELFHRIQNQRRTLVFPFEVTSSHIRALSGDPRFILPDFPTNDKAEHNFVLRHCGFTKLPRLFMVCVDGTIVDTYESYEKTMSSLSNIVTENTSSNIERFAQSIVLAIDRLHLEDGLDAFVKLDAAGAGGWSCMSPEQHPILYDICHSQAERITYVIDYITRNVIDRHLPTHAVVEEYIEAELRPGDIPADYTVCGLLLNGKFFPTSISLCGTDNAGQYLEQWTASHAEYLDDPDSDWQSMFETYRAMSERECPILHYTNGIYAGDLFLTKVHREHKQRDWNIRRGGRSTPETLILTNEYQVNYECKVTLNVNTIVDSIRLTDEEFFLLYTRICDELANGPYHIYPFSTNYSYFSRMNDDHFLKFDLIINPRLLVDDQKTRLVKSKHRDQVYQLVTHVACEQILAIVNSRKE